MNIISGILLLFIIAQTVEGQGGLGSVQNLISVVTAVAKMTQNPAIGNGMRNVVSGINGIIDTAKSIQSAASSMSSLLSGFANQAEESVRKNNVVKAEEGSNRYKQFYINNPKTRANITTRPKHIPNIWNMASNSYRVEFMLYNRENASVPEILHVENATKSQGFDKTKETKLIIHDFNQTYADSLIMQLKYEYLQNDDFNVILVDWIQARANSYTVAAKITEFTGVMCARFLLELDADLNSTHVIGFGLGSHAAGVMGNDLNGKLGRITGLDPSLPLFRMALDNLRLDAEDAIFVDVIHTDGGDNFWTANHLGMGQVMGHVDIYANKGISQPGCRNPPIPSYEDMYCSHIRSLELFVESVVNKEKLVGCSCESYSQFRAMNCDCTMKMIYIGDSTPTKAKGKFYLVTGNKPPYGLGRNGAFPIPQFNKLKLM